MSDLTDRLRDPFDRPARADINALLDEAADALEASERRAAKLDTALGEALDIAQAANDDCKTLKAELVAAQAVIAEAVEFASNAAYRGDDGVVDGDEVLRILSQSPTDALAAHDRQVAAKALRDWADMQERTLENFAYVADDCDRSETAQWCKAIRLYADRIVSEPSTPEGESE